MFADDAVRMLRRRGRTAKRLEDGFREWRGAGRSVAEDCQHDNERGDGMSDVSTWILMADPEGNEICVCDAGRLASH